MQKIIFRNARLVNRGTTKTADILVHGDRISKIDATISVDNAEEVECNGHWVIPGIIDDQVHFREPGMVYKADI